MIFSHETYSSSRNETQSQSKYKSQIRYFFFTNFLISLCVLYQNELYVYRKLFNLI